MPIYLEATGAGVGIIGVLLFFGSLIRASEGVGRLSLVVLAGAGVLSTTAISLLRHQTPIVLAAAIGSALLGIFVVTGGHVERFVDLDTLTGVEPDEDARNERDRFQGKVLLRVAPVVGLVLLAYRHYL